MTYSRTHSRGFTLIELIVVISIIGLLTAVVLASLSTARIRGYDAQRKTDLTRMRIALELYNDTYNAYPSTGGGWYGVGPPVTAVSDWIPGLTAGGFIRTLPQDPLYPQVAGGICGSAWPSMYLYRSTNGTGYELLDVCQARSSVANTAVTDPFYDPIRPTFGWKLCSGTECNE